MDLDWRYFLTTKWIRKNHWLFLFVLRVYIELKEAVMLKVRGQLFKRAWFSFALIFEFGCSKRHGNIGDYLFYFPSCIMILNMVYKRQSIYCYSFMDSCSSYCLIWNHKYWYWNYKTYIACSYCGACWKF